MIVRKVNIRLRFSPSIRGSEEDTMALVNRSRDELSLLPQAGSLRARIWETLDRIQNVDVSRIAAVFALHPPDRRLRGREG